MSNPGSTFRTAEPDMTKLLDQIHEGEIQLPDFQRGWVWDDSHIRGAHRQCLEVVSNRLGHAVGDWWRRCAV